MIEFLDMCDALDCWMQPIILKTVACESVDFEETQTVTRETIDAVVQPTTDDKLRALNIDHSLQYQTIHTKSEIQEGQFFEFQGRDFKIISIKPWRQFGYNDGIGEETKRDLL